ncbi:ClpP/crotonase-like domain-containing protein [Baffinella frigidus]|nr:ClpP/crotonase-like domain-containing protein [Cryptophyta sp. CCMP2293]
MSKGNKELEEVSRPAGLNDIGMVVWRLWMQTPECPDGRTMILIANDVTVQNGSFGVREDQLFLLATQLAEKEGLPRVYVAANTGARIGLVDEVKGKFRVQWKNPLNPTSGMEFLYLDDTEVDVLRKNDMVQTELVTASDGSKRHRITAVIGPDGIGVENLRGAGTIAGSTCRAYRDIFTLTFVSGTSVGIGAYLVRLGQRAIQKGPPILLTGEAALNKVLGKKVYTSNYQLGGTQIMYNNGVTHEVVSDDLEGVSAILSWVSFVPAVKGGVLPVLRCPPEPLGTLDCMNPERYALHATPYTILWHPPSSWTRSTARSSTRGAGPTPRRSTTPASCSRYTPHPNLDILDTRTTTLTHPADPADPDSKEKEVSQAGQVWFPDSAYKTATAIRDFNMEGLPLMIMANWRGFSGGQRDMYESILKFGSMIVEALVDYKQPVFVYIPPHGELRGGAWVVIDPTINAEQMEMYTDTTARGGILEPAAGIVEIKYRHDQLLQTMARLDPEIASINIQMASATDQDRRSLADQLKARQALLLPFYQRVAEHYADLHDVPVRMTKKGCINGIVDWRHARPFFYARLRRRLAEQTALQKLHAADPESDVASRKVPPPKHSFFPSYFSFFTLEVE